MAIFHYIINQKRNNFIKHCPPPPCTNPEAADIRDVYLYKKLSMQVGSLYTGGGTMFYRLKYPRDVGLQHTKYIIANGKLRQSSTSW